MISLRESVCVHHNVAAINVLMRFGIIVTKVTSVSPSDETRPGIANI